MVEKVKTWLSPLVSALLGLCLAGTAYLNSQQTKEHDAMYSNLDKRISLVENKTGEITALTKQLSDLNLRLTELIVKMKLFHETK